MFDNIDFSKISILVVDDEPSILKAVRRVLIPERFNVFTAESGFEGLEILKEERIDLVISDYKMPKMNGFEFLKKVKNEYPNVYRIILSGYIEEGIVADGILRGIASTFIGKPWEGDALINKIKQISSIYMTINDEKLTQYINSIEKLPSLPETYREVSHAMENNASAKQLEDIIKKDISLATEILHIANSIFYGSYKTLSLRQAIVRIGSLQLKNLILFNTMKNLSYTEVQKPHVRKLFNAAFVASKYYSSIYEAIFGEKLSVNYEAIPLLYNIGKVLLLRFDFQNFFKITNNLRKENFYSFSKSEDEIKNIINHRDLGAYFLCSWNLPEIFIESSLFYTTPEKSSNEYKKEIKALSILDTIVSFLTHGNKKELKEANFDADFFDFEKVEKIVNKMEKEFGEANIV